MHTLNSVLSDRAGRAPSTPDVDGMLAAVRDQAGNRRRIRTVTASAAAGLVVVGGVVTVYAATQPGQHQSAGSGSPDFKARPLYSGPAPGGRSASASTSSASATSTSLVTVPPAPKRAETSVTLVPRGFTTLAVGPTGITYARSSDPNAHDPNTWDHKLSVIVGTRYSPSSAFPLTVAGRPARYTGGSSQSVEVVVADRNRAELSVIVQASANLKLTRPQLMEIAQTLDVRSTRHYSSG